MLVDTMRKYKSEITYLSLLIIALVGGLGIVYATRWGPGMMSDSVSYIAGPRNLLAGYGLGQFRASGNFVQSAHAPPLYSLILSFWGYLGFDLVDTARWMNVVLFMTLILSVGLATYFLTSRRALAIVLSLIIASSTLLVGLFSGVNTEPLFITTTIAGLYALSGHLNKRTQPLLIGAGILAALALFTRYMGIALLFTGMLLLLFQGKLFWRQRIKDTVIFSGLTMLIITPWLIYQSFLGNSARTLDFNLTNLWERLRPIRAAFVDFTWSTIPFSIHLPVPPYRMRFLLVGILGIVIVLLAGLFVRKYLTERHTSGSIDPGILIALTFASYSIIYLITLTLTFLFSEPTPDLSGRILSPAWVTLLIALITLLFTASDLSFHQRSLRYAPIFLTLVIMASNSIMSFDKIQNLYHHGLGYTSPRWRSSVTIESLRSLPEDISIITNDSDAVLFYLNRPSYDLPEILLDEPKEVFLPFGNDSTNGIERIFREEGAALVLFNPLEWQLRPIYGDDTQARIQSLTGGLTVFFDSYDGSIYFYPTPEGSNSLP
jgi:hypothetical protein